MENKFEELSESGTKRQRDRAYTRKDKDNLGIPMGSYSVILRCIQPRNMRELTPHRAILDQW